MNSVADLLSIPQAARVAGATRQAVHWWAAYGLAGVKLRATFVGGRLVVRRADLKKFLRRVGREPAGK